MTENQLIAIFGKEKVELAKAMVNPIKNCRAWDYPPARKKVVIGWR